MTELSPEPTVAFPHLSRTSGPVMLWEPGVGCVISGMYFGWNPGLAEGGTYGWAVAAFFSIILYLTFTFFYPYFLLIALIPSAIFFIAMVTLNIKLAFQYRLVKNSYLFQARRATLCASGINITTAPQGHKEAQHIFLCFSVSSVSLWLKQFRRKPGKDTERRFAS